MQKADLCGCFRCRSGGTDRTCIGFFPDLGWDGPDRTNEQTDSISVEKLERKMEALPMEYQVKTAHGTLFCRREGSGPLLLLIHGVACDSEFFVRHSAILSKKLQ